MDGRGSSSSLLQVPAGENPSAAGVGGRRLTGEVSGYGEVGFRRGGGWGLDWYQQQGAGRSKSSSWSGCCRGGSASNSGDWGH